MTFTILKNEVKNKFHFVSLGCPRNLVDSEVMLGLLLKAGYEVTEKMDEADYLIINTCAFLEASRVESKEEIHTLLATKKRGAKLIVAGCMVTKHREELEREFPEIHYYIGSGDVEKILEAVSSDERGVAIGSARSYLEVGDVPRKVTTGGHFAYLKIAEGCRKLCAYCIIPKIKGPLRSKPIERIVSEFKALLNQGVSEVILIAQDLGDYGKDLEWKEGGLSHLLEELLKVKGHYWLRLLYLYPDEIDDKIIALLKRDQRLCPYLDMPLQHINNRILKKMRRHTSKEQILNILSKLHREVPGVHIRTSLIVGFPSETEEEFEELVRFVQEAHIHHIGIFKYSQEEGTPAGSMPEQIPEEIKELRLNRLVQTQQNVQLKINQGMQGKVVEAVVEGYHPESKLLMVARHKGQCPDIDGYIVINDGRKVKAFGQRYLVEITGYMDYDLVGKVLKPISPLALV